MSKNDKTDRTPPDEARALLEQAIAVSGYSSRGFAETIMVRDERTIRRWRQGQEIPEVALRRCRLVIREAEDE